MVILLLLAETGNMAKKNRSTLKHYFREGTLPSEDNFGDLIDSSLNLVDEGFDKTPENGFKLSLVGEHDRLISFFRNLADKNAVWSINYDKEQDRLFIKKPDTETPPAMTFAGDGKVGVNKINPAYALDVNGVVASQGRIGTYPANPVPADGKWHNIIGPLTGCHAFEIMAGVGKKGTGKYALMKAVALNTFNPEGWLFNFLNLKKKIKYHQANYRSRSDQIRLRWFKDKNKDNSYYLQMRTHCDYGEGIQIKFYITQLWFDEDMSEPWAPDENEQICSND